MQQGKTEMNEREQMIRELKNSVIPVLKKNGFKGSFPHFRRINEDKVNLITFQFDKWGGGFCIEITNGNPDGFKDVFGNFIEPKKMTAHDIVKRVRLGSKDDNSDYWFRYDKKSGDRFTLTAKEVIGKLPWAEEWFRKNMIFS
jgi:hypothetical protein